MRDLAAEVVSAADTCIWRVFESIHMFVLGCFLFVCCWGFFLGGWVIVLHNWAWMILICVLSLVVQCLDLIESSRIMASQLCEDVDLHIMMHRAYGKGFIKTCKVTWCKGRRPLLSFCDLSQSPHLLIPLEICQLIWVVDCYSVSFSFCCLTQIYSFCCLTQ